MRILDAVLLLFREIISPFLHVFQGTTIIGARVGVHRDASRNRSHILFSFFSQSLKLGSIILRNCHSTDHRDKNSTPQPPTKIAQHFPNHLPSFKTPVLRKRNETNKTPATPAMRIHEGISSSHSQRMQDRPQIFQLVLSSLCCHFCLTFHLLPSRSSKCGFTIISVLHYRVANTT